VHVALRSGLELPALALASGDDRGGAVALRQVAALAESAGFATLWFAEAPRAPVLGATVWSDPFVLAASCVRDAPSLHLGVVAGDGGDRHPSVVAREVTALDHVSGGRAALRLAYPGRAAEAARVCRGLFTGGETTVDGPVYRTDHAVNLPPPVQPGGPPLVAQVEADELEGDLASVVDAVCVSDAEAVARARAVLSGPAVVWVGSLAENAGEAAQQVERLAAAGAEGIVCRVGDLTQVTAPTLGAWADAAARVGS
jgi:hypothetical protein